MTDNASVATIDGTGMLMGVATGSATITATSEGRSGSTTVTVTPPPVASVEVAPPSATLTEGDTLRFSATLRDANDNILNGRAISWTSSDSSVARLSNTGLLTALKAGTVTITARSEGIAGSASVTVRPASVASVTLTPQSATLQVGDTLQLTATLRDPNGNTLVGRPIAWTSSDSTVASVSNSGLITGITAGTATIVASSQGITGSVTVTVTAAPVVGAFVLIQPGSFQMGSTNGESDELPVHTVSITKAFWLQTTEVTRGEWRVVMGSDPISDSCGDACPVSLVSWDEVQTFIQRLNAANPGANYRLPTEAEWEYATRAGTTGDYGGNGVLDDMGWHGGNSGGTIHPVGLKRPNAWGIYDAHGNVWEWVMDRYSASYYSTSPVSDPPGPPSGSDRVVRGGSYLTGADPTRSAERLNILPSLRFVSVGFRLARTP
jgi:formylglycine-generating enzyme required for sulfatase activity